MTTFMKNIGLEQWTVVPDNPRQRDTERHANKIERYLQVVMPQHAVVHAAQLPNGDLIKLDGHTRCLLWDANRIPQPHQLSVVIHPATDMAQAMQMYDLYDQQLGVKGRPDDVFGAFREHGIRPESRMLQRGTLTSALGLAVSAQEGRSTNTRWSLDVNAEIAKWKSEVIGLDRLIAGHETRRVHSSIAAAIMMTIRRRGFQTVAPFWTQYMDPNENGNVGDPHNLLLKYLRKVQAEHKTNGRANQTDIVEKALSACENGLIGKRMRWLMGTSMAKYLHTQSGHRLPADRLTQAPEHENRVSF